MVKKIRNSRYPKGTKGEGIKDIWNWLKDKSGKAYKFVKENDKKILDHVEEAVHHLPKVGEFLSPAVKKQMQWEGIEGIAKKVKSGTKRYRDYKDMPPSVYDGDGRGIKHKRQHGGFLPPFDPISMMMGPMMSMFKGKGKGQHGQGATGLFDWLGPLNLLGLGRKKKGQAGQGATGLFDWMGPLNLLGLGRKKRGGSLRLAGRGLGLAGGELKRANASENSNNELPNSVRANRVHHGGVMHQSNPLGQHRVRSAYMEYQP